ncbi:MAG: BspA family leucine-rich repeat surface protein [Muribaculaceae bacterium]|nr:BspA family leucine-rich repeat surface protein [Muribaculaceae bacterium]
MKRILSLLIAVSSCIMMWAAEGYAVFNVRNATLTFYYGDKPDGAFSLNTGDNHPQWFEHGTSLVVKKVVFDESFAQARPTTTSFWFHAMDNLTTITGLENLNTSQVTRMIYMFSSCQNLTSLDLSSFNTSNVTDMQYMFKGCKNLTSLDLSSFNTSNVTDMQYMFNECKNLTSLDLSSFNTAKVTNMIAMFINCSNLTSLNLSSFNTSNVKYMFKMFFDCSNLTSLNLSGFNTTKATDMGGMFSECRKLPTLDLSSFNTSNVTDMRGMFESCINLNTIIVGSSWTTTAVTYSERMFNSCTSIVGGAGTTYDANHVDATYARIDGGASKPGYFTAKPITTYDLWINGEQVTSENYSNITGTGISGKVYYNYWQKRLMLEDATISNSTNGGTCITSEIDGLIINLIGTNSLSSQTGFRARAMNLANTTIRGTGTLTATGLSAGITIQDGKTLTINNVSNLSATGNNYGFYANNPTNSSLVIKGSKTTVHATGAAGAIRNISSLVLEDGLEITQPAGGYFNGTILYDANGNIATQATISNPANGLLGDLDGSGIVDVEDVNAAINIILKLKTINDYPGNGDMDGNGYIDVEDVNAMINIILKL